MSRFVLVALVLGLAAGFAACNPAARCITTADCAAGVCSGGFCTDLAAGGGAGGGTGNQGEYTDFDEGDGGAVPDAGDPEPDAGNNGRD